MKAVEAAFNQEKALVGAFSVITHLRMDLRLKLYYRWERGGVPTGIFPGKYEWAGDRGQGDCSLLVRDADREFDDGSWQCSVSPSSFQVSASWQQLQL